MSAARRALIIIAALTLAGCAIDVNAYHAHGGSTGPIHCAGACQ